VSGASRPSRLGPFRHRAYVAYWFGVSVNNMGTWLQAVAGSVFVYQLTGSSFDVGVFNFAGFIPILLFSVQGGRLSDRLDRRRVVMITHALSMLTAAILAALTFLGLSGELTLIVATFLINVLWAMGKPSLQALIPNIVPREDLRDAVAMSSTGFQVGQVFGPLLAAAAIALSGPAAAFALNALTYLAPVASMAMLFRLGLGGRSAGGPAGATASLAASAAQHGAAKPGPGLIGSAAFLRANRWVLGLLAGIVVITMGMEIQRSLAPALVEDRLGQPESVVGLVVTAQSIGGLIGFLLFIQIRRLGWSERAAIAGLFLQGAGVVLLGIARDLATASAGFAMVGFGFSICFPVATAALQEWTPDGLRGRIMAYHQMALLGHRPFTAILLGAIATTLGLTAGLLAWLVVAPIGIAGVWLAWRNLRRQRSGEATASGPAPA
jgi:MFS family permease